MQNPQKLRILIVEDEAILAMMIEDMLIDLGHSVAAVAGRVAEAEQHAVGSDFDLAILDLNLDGATSLPVASILLERGIPLIFSTGYGADALGPEWAAIPVLPKPFQMHDLRLVIERALNR